ncbi:MAG: hypothetical protein EU547_07200 [Promethearchaeota archaeon]|nr:MAG: hypothetical protein EU547_07200 [Candidatus Lokiarchaeota archaeon]
MSKENNSKMATIIIVAAIVIMTAMSIWIFLTASKVQSDSAAFAETSQKYDNLVDLAVEDIQGILQEDSIKHEEAYSLLQDVYSLNDQYKSMKEYNQTNPGAYSQQDFDEISMEVVSKVRLMIELVYNTSIHYYGRTEYNATVENDYSCYEKQSLFITNKWHENYSYYETLDVELKAYVQTDFDSTNDTYEIPEINFDVWTHFLYHNLSTLEVIYPTASSLQYLNIVHDINIDLANVSIIYLKRASDSYFILNQQTSNIVMDFNNNLVTFATAAVVLGFAISFGKKYRNLLIVVGIITMVLGFVYFISAFDQTLDYRTQRILDEIEFIGYY